MADGDLFVPDDVYLKCNQGASIKNLKASKKKHKLYGLYIATESDNKPIDNIPCFGNCSAMGKECKPNKTEWKKVHDGALKVEGKKPLLFTSFCKCQEGGSITIFIEKEEAKSSLDSDKGSRVDKIPWLDTAIGYSLSPVGCLVNDLTGGDSSNVGRGFRQGVKSTAKGLWEMVSHPIKTAKGIGKLAMTGIVGYIPPISEYPSAQEMELMQNWMNSTPEERIADFDKSTGMGLTSMHEGLKQAGNDFYDQKIENGTRAETEVMVGEVTEFAAELLIGSKGTSSAIKGIKESSLVANISEKASKAISVISKFVKERKLTKIVTGIFKVNLKKLKIPQGLTKLQFDNLSKFLREKVGHLSDDIAIQGSRAKGTAKVTSDIDIAIKVDEITFNKMIKEYFGTPNPGSAMERTMQHAIESGKITTRPAKLSKIRQETEKIIDMEVDLSIIKKGGAFDNPPYIPIK